MKARIGPALVILSGSAFMLAGLFHLVVAGLLGLSTGARIVSMANDLSSRAIFEELSNYGHVVDTVTSIYSYLNCFVAPASAALGMALSIYLAMGLPRLPRAASLAAPPLAAGASVAVRVIHLEMLRSGQFTGAAAGLAQAAGCIEVAAWAGHLSLLFWACLRYPPPRQRLVIAMVAAGALTLVLSYGEFAIWQLSAVWLPAFLLAIVEVFVPAKVVTAPA